jgi:hypothetical protein
VDAPDSGRERWRTLLGPAVAAIVLLSILFGFVAPVVVSGGLPSLGWASYGRNVAVPWGVCLYASAFASVLCPWLCMFPFVKAGKHRVALLAILVVALLLLAYPVGAVEGLDKAWRRGWISRIRR